MTDNIIATERKTNNSQYNSQREKQSGYYIVCHLFFFLLLLYCLSFVFLSVAIILSVICFPLWLLYWLICFSFCGYFIVCHLFFFLWLLYCLSDNIIATERKTNDRQYNSQREKQMTDNIIATERKTNLYCLSFVFRSAAIILSVICFSFCGYYIVCHLFFFLLLLYCLSFVITVNIIATERKTNDRQYNSHRKKNKWQTIK
jgi:hypothetical protein